MTAPAPSRSPFPVSGRVPRLAHLERADFLENCWDDLYELGEHVGFFEPTGQGKTHIAYQMLGVTMDQFPQARVASLMPKPKDPATIAWAKALNLALTDAWPAPPHFPGLQRKPSGHVLWPRHIKSSVEANRANLQRIFRKCLHEQYWKGNSITLADDVYKLAVILGLNLDLEEFWTSGQGMGSGLWAPNQKPSGTVAGSVSTFSYSAPAHLVFGHDPDVRNQKRFSEIGGVDPQVISAIVARLPVRAVMVNGKRKNISDKLYVSKLGYMCTIGI